MGISETLALINGILGLAFQAYNSISQIQGNTPIPSWDELTNQNAILQAKIDAEK
jgi:hypothetical protein